MEYIVISPVKDEERNIERTLASMVKQTCKPKVWVIVDDGSTDRTPEIIERYAKENSFIRILSNGRRTMRQTGIAEVLAFDAGLRLAGKEAFDIVVKLDGDLSFEADYFERLLRHFHEDSTLGIASGIYQEDRGDGWKTVPMPSYHACGASKMVRRECFEAIGGFIAERGWDTVDEVRAMARGWRTGHYEDAILKHWKPEGIGMGMLRTCYMHGEIYHRLGGGVGFFALKVLNRLRSAPILSGGGAMLWGYLHSRLKRRPLLVNAEERLIYRSLLSARLRAGGAGRQSASN